MSSAGVGFFRVYTDFRGTEIEIRGWWRSFPPPKIDEKKNKKKSKTIRVRIWLVPMYSVVFSSYSRMCARVALLFWLSKMATRIDIIICGNFFDETGVKNGWRWQWAVRKIDDETLVSLFEKHEIMCYVTYDPVFFCPFFKVKLELQNAPDCTDLHPDFNIFPPRIGLTFRFWDFNSIPPLLQVSVVEQWWYVAVCVHCLLPPRWPCG